MVLLNLGQTCSLFVLFDLSFELFSVSQMHPLLGFSFLKFALLDLDVLHPSQFSPLIISISWPPLLLLLFYYVSIPCHSYTCRLVTSLAVESLNSWLIKRSLLMIRYFKKVSISYDPSLKYLGRTVVVLNRSGRRWTRQFELLLHFYQFSWRGYHVLFHYIGAWDLRHHVFTIQF